MRRVEEFADDPVRPELPVSLSCAITLWLSCALCLTLAISWDAGVCLSVGVTGFLAALLCLAMLWKKRSALVWVSLLGLALGCGIAGVSAAETHHIQSEVCGHEGKWYCEAVSDGTKGIYGSTCFVRVYIPGKESCIVRAHLKCNEKLVRYGDTFKADLSLSAPKGNAALRCWQNGAVGDTYLNNFHMVKRTDGIAAIFTLRNRAIDLLEGSEQEGSEILAALICGWRADINKTTYSAFKATGLAHIVAVSGAHLCLVSSLISLLLRKMNMPHFFTGLIQMTFLLGYVLLAGAPPSATRAFVMVCPTLLATYAHRRAHVQSALALCIIGCIVFNPYAALCTSFALSVFSTLSIVLFAPLITSWIVRLIPYLPRFVTEAFSLSVASGILALLPAASLFSQVSLVAPLANVAISPLLVPVCATGMIALASSAATPYLAPIVLSIANRGACCLVWVAKGFAHLPHASIPFDISPVLALVLSGVGAIVLWRVWPLLDRRHVKSARGVLLGIAVVMFIFLGLPKSADDEIVMFDIGQGDAFLLRSKDASILIDTGNQDRLLREALARHQVFHLDGVVITHSDSDHRGSLSSLTGLVDVECVLVANDALTCPCENCKMLMEDACELVGEGGVRGLCVGDHIKVGSFDLKVVWPDEYTNEGGNEDSLCLVLEADVDADNSVDWKALFVGDAECEQVSALVGKEDVGRVDIYKVGHHGSRHALDDNLAKLLSPQIALISVGAHNRYGHPAAETLSRLEEVGAHVLRSDQKGDVSCKLEPDRIVVETLR